jgi:hypothetical protein
MKKNKALASIFKNIPIELWKEVAKFKTKGKREYSVSIHGREPLPGKQYGWGGSLKLDDCQSVDVYVRPTDESYFTKLRNENRELSLYNTELLKDNHEQQERLQEYSVELEKARRVVMVLDRRQGGERRSN